MLTFTSFSYPIDYLNRLRSLFYMMVGIPMGLFLILFLANKQESLEPLLPSPHLAINLVLPIASLAGVVLTYLRYFKKLKEVKRIDSLKEKLIVFYSLKAQTFLLLAAFSILLLLGYWLTLHVLFTGAYVAILILFAMNNPSYHNVASELKLGKDEREVMKTNSEIRE